MEGDFKNLFGEDWRPSEFDEGRKRPSERGPDPSGEDRPDFTSELENRTPRSLQEKEVKVMGVYMHNNQEAGTPPQYFVLLRDNRERRVPIFVGQPEAWGISYAVDNETADRPLTHDLMKILLEKLNVNVERIVIDDLWQDTFYAKITLVKPSGEYAEVDARPSDAIALALRMRAPIYMAESVLEATIRPE